MANGTLAPDVPDTALRGAINVTAVYTISEESRLL